MGYAKICALLILTWALLVSSTHQLKTYERQLLLQLRKHLEYPAQLNLWENFTGDLCTISSSPRLSIKCQDDSVTELKIFGDKLSKVSINYNGFAVPDETLSSTFSVDSLVTTLTRLTNLRVLSLVSLGIWGPLPDKIHRLNALEVLDLSSNYLFGSIPSDISRLQKLQILTLDGNFFNDTVPDWLGSLSNLTILRLQNNSLKGPIPPSVARITTLTDLVLSHNLLSGKLPDMTALSNLHLLDLMGNRFDSELPSLPKGLGTILLSNNSLSGAIPEDYGKLNQLQRLDLSNNVLTGVPPAKLFALPNVSYLNLGSNRLSGSLPDHLECGEKLGFIDISDNELVGALPLCLNSSDRRNVRFDGNCLSIDAKNQHPESFCKEAAKGKKQRTGKEIAVLVGVLGGIVIVVILLAVSILVFWRRHSSRGTVEQRSLPKVPLDNPPSGISSDVLANARIISQAAKIGGQVMPAYRVFSLDELKEATGNFDPSALIGEGSMGKVYKGRLENETYVAVRLLVFYRRCYIRNLKLRLDLLSKLRHPHLVGLLGHCIEGGNQDDSSVTRLYLVYEFVPNGNFRAHLSETSPEKVLKWPDRLAVLIGVAKAVHFLHTGVIPPCFRNRLKTSNILLDEHCVAKLSDYGMSIINEDSEKNEGKGDGSKSWYLIKKEDDVYSFGFILLESLVGPTASGKGEAFLLNEMASFGSHDGRRRVVDPVVLTTSSQESLSIVISITNKCISPELSSRPSFEDVLWNLQYAAQVQATADSDQKSDATSQSKEG